MEWRKYTQQNGPQDIKASKSHYITWPPPRQGVPGGLVRASMWVAQDRPLPSVLSGYLEDQEISRHGKKFALGKCKYALEFNTSLTFKLPSLHSLVHGGCYDLFNFS